MLALVDAQELYPTRDGLSPSGLGRGFYGHYVLLAGADAATDEYVVKDPAREEEESYVPAARFERARRARGTDEDLLVLPVRQGAPRPPAGDLKISAALRSR